MEYSPLLEETNNVRFRGTQHHITIAGGGDENKRVGLVSIFVVAFDTKAGNVIEWQLPSSYHLQKVEFKALASGAHNIDHDFTYFRVGSMYGMSCYERKLIETHNEEDNPANGTSLHHTKKEPSTNNVATGKLVDIEDNIANINLINIKEGDNGGGGEMVVKKRKDERGGRMKSVGVLCHSYHELSCHFAFLKTQVHRILETQNDYKELVDYWEEHQEKENHYVVASVQSFHPDHSFGDFLVHYGAKTLTLWKLVMCGAKILIYSTPPIGAKCFHVHCLSQLGRHSHERSLSHRPRTHPLFYINVADIDQLNQHNYIACTTEKIFQMKEQLYDVMLIDGEIIVSNPAFKSITKTNQSDVDKYKELLSLAKKDWDDDDVDDATSDSNYFEYFWDMNDRILNTLLENTGGEIGTNELKTLPIHPSYDRPFILHISEVYAIDVIVTLDNPCCPTSS